MERKKLPYGIPNFRSISEEGYVFVDKTQFVEKLEGLGEKYIFFLRPRKFGKSLFVSMLEHYYDITYRDKFEKLFGDFYIGKNPTPLHNSYLVLLFDFSGIDTETKETTREGFLNKVNSGVERFANKYSELFDNSMFREFLKLSSPELVIEQFLTYITSRTDKGIYLLIDEYDHFANELLAFRMDLFKELISRTGFVRKFYEVLKTGARDGIIDRMFITGVAPITLDSFTSGFNIGTNLSLEEDFHNMLGFTEDETYKLIELVCPENSCPPDNIYEQMTNYYNGYKFSKRLANGRLFNPDMVLYYLRSCMRYNRPPDELIDVNIASDYKKVGNLINLLELEEGRSILSDLMEKNSVSGNLTIQFNLERDFYRDDFLSLMLYTGFITIERQRGNRYVFRMPNYVVEKLYYQYFYELLEKRYSLRVKRDELDDAVERMAYEGDVSKFVKVVEEFMKKVLSNRDFRGFREAHLKVHVLTLLYLNGLYYIQSEMEAERGYIDIFLRERQPFKVEYEWVLELKYVQKGKTDNMEQLKVEGEEQLKRYMEKVLSQARHTLRGALMMFTGAGECLFKTVV